LTAIEQTDYACAKINHIDMVTEGEFKMELTPLAGHGAMTEMERFIFESFGYIIIEDVITEEECDAVLAAATRLHDGQEKEKLHQIGRGFETEPAIENLIDHPAIFPKIRALYGDRFVLQSAWCTVQPAGSESVGWHQDGSSAYEFKHVGYPPPLLQLRASYALTDQSNLFTGNMMMIPGSHRSPLELPESARKDIEASPIQHNIRCKPGTVLLFHNGVWHSPMPNRQDIDRYNMHYIFSPPWVRRSDRDATNPEFLERTTPLRRALMGDYDRPDKPFGAGGYPPLPFED
jgi:ectoine hydroxylase-related dioxygenase (phytanoyl-CoA dioxygenase family)